MFTNLLGCNVEKGLFCLRCCANFEKEGVCSDVTSIDLDCASTPTTDVYKGSTCTNGSCKIIRSFKYL